MTPKNDPQKTGKLIWFYQPVEIFEMKKKTTGQIIMPKQASLKIFEISQKGRDEIKN